MDATDKAEIRKQIKKLRNDMSQDDCQRISESICQRLFSLDTYKKKRHICAYISKGNEVDTRPIIEKAWNDGMLVYVPKVYGEVMHFIRIDSFDDVEKGKFGIMEPISDAISDPEDAVIIMPGVAFDHDRNRIGFGGGYYDRYLEAHSGLTKIALAYEFQIVGHIDSEKNDKKPDLIVTEKHIIS